MSLFSFSVGIEVNFICHLVKFDCHTVINLSLHRIPLFFQLWEQILQFLLLAALTTLVESLFDFSVRLNFLMQLVLALFFLRQLFEECSDTASLVSYVGLLFTLNNYYILVELLLHLGLPLLEFVSCCPVLSDTASLHVYFGLLFFSERFKGYLNSFFDFIF